MDGGNTFYLQKHIQLTKFWSVVDPILKKGCAYIGASAGAIVAGQSIKTAYWKGWDDENVGFEWNEETLKGHGLVEYDIFPHYVKDQHHDLLETKLRTHECSVKYISDSMSIVRSVEDDLIRDFTLNSDGSLSSVKLTSRK